MTPEEAEQIVRDYGGAVASLKPGDAVLPESALPYSKTRIKHAFYTYIEALVEMGALEDDHASALVQTYALLNTRFREGAEHINVLYKHYAKNEDARKELDKYGGITIGMPSIDDMEELRGYIEECMSKH
jgi:hypothetical protein